jgi:hypothetical protein
MTGRGETGYIQPKFYVCNVVAFIGTHPPERSVIAGGVAHRPEDVNTRPITARRIQELPKCARRLGIAARFGRTGLPATRRLLRNFTST